MSLSYPQSFAFSFSGATPQSASSSGSTGSGGTGTGSGSGSGGTGTGTTTTASAFSPFSVVGTLATDGNGNFALSETSISNGSTVRSKAGGTYTVDANCGLKLTFSSSNPATTANFKAPVSFQGLTSDANGGVLLMQPDQNTTLAGTFIVQ